MKYESIAYLQRRQEQEYYDPQLLLEQQQCLQVLLMLGCMLLVTMKLNKQLLRNTYMQSYRRPQHHCFQALLATAPVRPSALAVVAADMRASVTRDDMKDDEV